MPKSKVISLDERVKDEEKPFLEQKLVHGAKNPRWYAMTRRRVCVVGHSATPTDRGKLSGDPPCSSGASPDAQTARRR